MNMPFVEIVGAGPGAEDLITVRGLRALQQADLVVYAGSLVAPALLRHCRPDCLCRDSASMDLAEQVAVMSEAALAGKRVVRLHTGDPALYGAIDEQIRGLAQRGITVRITPGVSSVFAAAAALGCELTGPETAQSVVLTRTPGRTPMPAGEQAAAFARTGATLAFFLSTGKVADLMAELQDAGGLAPDTPAAAVYRASWPDAAWWPIWPARWKKLASGGSPLFWWAVPWLLPRRSRACTTALFPTATATACPTRPSTAPAPSMPPARRDWPRRVRWPPH